MLIGYVSDERYVAIADALLEFERDGQTVAVVRSSPRGAVWADIEPGTYRVTLVKDGFGSKIVSVDLSLEQAHHFRLLSDRLLGYVFPKWVKSGERAEFRVHSPEPYRLSLWRYGLKKEFVQLLGWFDEHGPRANQQITPDGDYTQTGVQWNKVGWHNPQHRQLVTAPERSGLYYFHAKGESGAFFSFPWIVAPAQPQARIAVLASSINWNAYNNFGGRSNYINAEGLPPQPIVNARQELARYQPGAYSAWQFPNEAYKPLSFDRPEPLNHIPEHTEVTDPIEGRQPCHTAPAEWRLLGWLEREGFAYDLYSECQLHFGQLDLDAYKVLILGPHPEYWSRTMFERVKAWVHERGGRLMYLGGNGLNCEVEFLDEHTMRCKAQWLQDDPHESRFHRTTGMSEASLLGVVYDDRGVMTAAPYRCVNPSHWVFEGTGLREGDLFGTESLHERIPGGASGHETDKRSASSPPNTILLAKGLNPEEGGAEMVIYETDSGGAVFSVGSICYPAALLVDDRVSAVTRNVLN
ncbi:MAG: hypothetical protein NZT92_11975, partial [Abditibacteriales bacterium]|nr:hypothetical protein [Abditibacteriales bacterium]MDW8366662.1 hypothetical protein [Abditibacteriales bacterium]